ncbi:unnamed protein product [Medioppia subpectinata]|uniref:Uncharacterized protein n=1 Tax=Medioppia subpectinata TaxID=1979941 RepID=A0A7R9Q1J4_9ACAR|nr:unnamed protein product [Medioppia subpectinata]CAG2109292.1 unnamed protein product [Medioppia subpectinata]
MPFCHCINPVPLSPCLSQWAPEVSHHCPNAAIILVGTDEHLRPLSGNIDLTALAVTYSEGMAAARGMGAYKYMECSAVTGDGVTEVFATAVVAILHPKSTPRQSKSTCVLS